MPDASIFKLTPYGPHNGSYNDWSIPDSVRPNDRYIPVDSTLGASDTAEDLVNIESLPEAAVNLFVNPSFETDDISSVWTDDGAAPSQSAAAARSGSNHLLLNPDNAAAEVGGYFTINLPGSEGTQGGTLFVNISCYVRGASASGDFQIKVQDSSGTDLVTTASYSLTASYARQNISYRLDPVPGQKTYRIWLGSVTQHNIDIYVDDLQVEVNTGGHITDFINVTLGEINCGWQGTANASYSQRLDPIRQINSWLVTVTQDVYLAIDHTADNTNTGTGYPSILIKAGVWSLDLPVVANSRISFINAVASQTPRIHGVVMGKSQL